MARVIVLGSSNAIATEDHENTHMVIVGKEKTIMVDCVSSPLLRLKRAGVEFDALSDLVLTHFHPDHVSGVPLLLMDMWLLGRKSALEIHGLDHTLERIEALMEFHGWSQWPRFFPVHFRRVPEREMVPILHASDLRLLGSPVRHLVPTIGLRMEFPQSQKVLTYSCDTEPCSEVVRLAAGADVLIHEAAGFGRGHSSAAQAAGVATQAEVGRLLLIHYPTGANATEDLIAEARPQYQGEIGLAEDFMQLDMG